MQLSNVVNWRQQHEGDCLAACAAMVLTHLGQRVNYPQLMQRLGTTRDGTPFSHLDHLGSLRLRVEVVTGNLSMLNHQLTNGHPIIVPVATELLPYWLVRPDLSKEERMTEHAVVVVGIDENQIYVNDPDFDNAPQMVESGWFEEAWRHHDRRSAIIQRRWF